MNANRMRLWLLALVLTLLLPAAALAEPLTVENDLLTLTLDEDTLEITLTDKATGGVLVSGVDPDSTNANASWKGFLSSILSVEVTKENSVTPERVDVRAAEVVKKVIPVEGGADVEIDFTERCQRLRLEIRLEGDSVALTVPAESIEEYGATSLCGIYLMPCMGATRYNEHEGYMFVPEAAGAIINLADGKSKGNTPYSKRIYGTNIGVDKAVSTDLSRAAEKVTMPLYGMAYTDDGLGFLAVVEKGAEAAEVMAYPAGVITEFNWVASRFTLREQYIMQTTRTQGLTARESQAYLRDMSVRFYVLTGEEASYAGMARRCRQSLEEKGQLKTVPAAYHPRIDFLGADSEKFLLWNTLVSMTTVDQAREILSTFDEAGLTAPLVLMRGWQKGGLTPSLGGGDMGLERRLGSENDLAELRRETEARGGRFLMEMDTVQANSERMYNMRLDIVRTIGQTVAEIEDNEVLLYYLTPRRTADMLADFQKKWSGKTEGLAVTTMTDTLYSFYSAGGNHSRGETMQSYLEALEGLDMSLALSNPFIPYWPEMDVYLDMPLGTTSYSFVAAEVPFLPMLLSGHVPYYTDWANFESNPRWQLLKMVEYGAYPSWIITGEDVQKLIHTNTSYIYRGKWDVMMPEILETDKTLREVFTQLEGQTMADHCLLAEDVAQVTYSGGSRVIVNYRRTPYRVDGKTVPAMDFVVMKGGETP